MCWLWQGVQPTERLLEILLRLLAEDERRGKDRSLMQMKVNNDNIAKINEKLKELIKKLHKTLF